MGRVGIEGGGVGSRRMGGELLLGWVGLYHVPVLGQQSVR